MDTVRLCEVYDATQRALENGDNQRAALLAEHILGHYPKHLGANLVSAQVNLADGNIDEASRQFDHVLRLDPENANAMIGKADALHQEGDRASATQLYEEALDVAPSLRSPKQKLAELNRELGKLSYRVKTSEYGLPRLFLNQHLLVQAVSEFKKVAPQAGDRLDVQLGLAEAFWVSGRKTDAADVCRRILHDDQECLKANLMTAIVSFGQLNRDDAETRLAIAREIDPTDELLCSLLGSESLPADFPAAPAATLPAPEGVDLFARAVPAPEAIEEKAPAEEEVLFSMGAMSFEEESAEESISLDMSWLEQIEPIEPAMADQIRADLAEDDAEAAALLQSIENPDQSLEELLAEAEAMSREIEQELNVMQESETTVPATGAEAECKIEEHPVEIIPALEAAEEIEGLPVSPEPSVVEEEPVEVTVIPEQPEEAAAPEPQFEESEAEMLTESEFWHRVTEEPAFAAPPLEIEIPAEAVQEKEELAEPAEAVDQGAPSPAFEEPETLEIELPVVEAEAAAEPELIAEIEAVPEEVEPEAEEIPEFEEMPVSPEAAVAGEAQAPSGYAVPAEPEVEEPLFAREPEAFAETEIPEYATAAQIPEERETQAIGAIPRLAEAKQMASEGKTDEALRAYRAGLRSGEVDAHTVLPDLEQLVASNLENKLAHVVLGEAYMDANRFAEAVDQLAWSPPKKKKKPWWEK